MEKQKAQMRVEERDKRAEELKNQMINIVPEAEEKKDDALPFEIPGIDTSDSVEEPLPEKEEEIIEEPEEEIIEEEKEEIVEEPKEEKVEEKKEKKKTDKQVSLFSF